MTPDYVLAASQRILVAVLPLFKRTPGAVADAEGYAAYRRIIDRLLADTRAAARSATLAVDLANVATGYRTAASDMRAVIDGFDRVVVAARAVVPVTARSATLAAQRENEIALAAYCECLALAGQAQAVSAVALRSHDEAQRLRARLVRSFDVGLDRASDRGDIEVMRLLRETLGKLARDLIERGRPLARIVSYETAVPLPAVVLAHMLYQDASRADELMAENAAHDHPAFMPMTGRAYSR